MASAEAHTAEAQKAIIKSADMSEEVQASAIEVARTALRTFETERDIAKHIKSTFDEQHGKHWHCIVGKAFGSFVTHDSGCFTYFYLGEVAVLLFKTL